MDWIDKRICRNRIALAAMIIIFTVVAGLYIASCPEGAPAAGGIWGFCVAAILVKNL